MAVVREQEASAVQQRDTSSARPVVGLVLAAGRGARMGSVKPLLPLGNRSLLEHVIDSACASRLEGMLIVASPEVASALAASAVHVSTIVNLHPERGQSLSLRLGLRSMPDRAAGCLVLMADQPGITSQAIDRIAAEFQSQRCDAVVPLYRGRRGTPVLLGRWFWPAAMQLRGDVGARRILAEHADRVRTVEVGDLADPTDLDTPEEYARCAAERGS